MKDAQDPTQTPKRSRLEPDPVPRRDFLGLAAAWSALAAGFFALLGMLRLPKAAVIPVPSRKFRVTLPESLAPGVPYIPKGRSVALFRDEEGVYAISTICTHLGCIVQPEPDGFHCPCHGSRFALDGSLLKGPAPKPLPWHPVRKVGGDTYLVDEGTFVPKGTRGKA
jgi:cytochrome b6-f complex iron-sulfur subunit